MAEESSDRARFFPAIEKKHGLPMAYWFDQMKEISDQKYPAQIAFLRENHGFSQAHANALVLYCRGSKNARKYSTFDEYLAEHDPVAVETLRSIFSVLMKKFPKLKLVIAWNHPMLMLGDSYLFGASIHTKHILLAPTNVDVLDEFRPRLVDYVVNKKTFAVPLDWKVNQKLLCDMMSTQLKAT
jgi:uncharacterized protein YdhG (YjbR/CyaY superfamily)